MKSVPVIRDFDGGKFAIRYSLNALRGDFWVDERRNLIFPDTLPDTPIQEVTDPPPSATPTTVFTNGVPDRNPAGFRLEKDSVLGYIYIPFYK